jgi:polysaccharide deacetylase family protein (PEP-CTERM system associated)
MKLSVINALTVDLEDWTQSVLDPGLPMTDCVVRNTERLLALLDRFKVRATFFALGTACEQFPDLLPTVAAAGHEIGTHGYRHELVYRMTPERFRADVQRSLDVIESQTGRRPVGYRAPAFSVTRRSLWAGPILYDLGIRYSSSIFPIAGRRYGIPDAPRFPHQWATCPLIEFPLSTIRRFKRNLPVSGGGYFRLLPGAVARAAIDELNREGQPAVVYLHPYELAANEIAELRRHGWCIDRWRGLTQSLFRGRMAGRLRRLLATFRFAPMADVLGLEHAAQACSKPRAVCLPGRALHMPLRLRPARNPEAETVSSSASGPGP